VNEYHIPEGLVEKFQSARGFPDNEVSPSGPDTGSDHGQISVNWFVVDEDF
jgi:hypothetical protein